LDVDTSGLPPEEKEWHKNRMEKQQAEFIAVAEHENAIAQEEAESATAAAEKAEKAEKAETGETKSGTKKAS
jgi:hypothetical protein